MREELPKLVTILLVEDNPHDAELAVRALRGGETRAAVSVAEDGQVALDLLDTMKPLPGLIIVDLNLPRVNGLELLAEIKANPALRRIPVIVLTTSDRVEDVTRSYESGANGYVCKPLLFDDYSRALASIREFWTRTAVLPTT